MSAYASSKEHGRPDLSRQLSSKQVELQVHCRVYFVTPGAMLKTKRLECSTSLCAWKVAWKVACQVPFVTLVPYMLLNNPAITVKLGCCTTCCGVIQHLFP